MNIVYIVLLTICAIVLGFVTFLIRNKSKDIEYTIYLIMTISSVISLTMEIITFMILYARDLPNIKLFALATKGLYVSFSSWLFFYAIYYIVVSINEDKREKIGKIIFICSNILLLGFVMAFVVLPLQVVYHDGMYMPVASAAILVYIVIALCSFILITLIFINRKKISDKKFWPLLFILVFFAIVLLVNNDYLDILLANPCTTLIIFIMFYTIENPDVKIIKKLEKERQEANRANNAKSDFLSNMSHEIRTPLNAIVGFSTALSERENISPEASDDIRNIILSSNTLLEIVNGILDISKIEANKLEIVEGPYKFIDLYDQLVALAKARMGDKKLTFRCTYDKRIPEYLYGDVGRVKQLAVNLLTNAIKYTPSGYVDFKINCIPRENNIRLIIIVEDSGIGVKKENYSKLFSKFERIEEDGNSAIEGTGLGLAITKKLVELMNGGIAVNSTYGYGSTFTLAINQGSVPENIVLELQREEEARKVEMSSIDISNKKVLIVDDNMMNIKVAERLLREYKLDLHSVTSGQECINEIKAGNTYDLILLDDLMPLMSGVETLRELKNIAGFNISTVILTANALSGMKEEYLKQGFNDYLSKPIEKKELERVLKKFLNNKNNI